MGTRRKIKGRGKERWTNENTGRVTNHRLTEEDRRDRNIWRNLLSAERKPL
jgi:hypothetical protein